MCIARGPAWPDNFRSNEIIAQRQADKARDLLTSATEEVTGTATQHENSLRGFCVSCLVVRVLW